jgi:hypothetical protein
MKCMNQIAEVLQDKGVTNLTPNKETLKLLGIHIHSWNKWVKKKSDPEFFQVPEIARFLDCDISEIFPKPVDADYSSKHKLLV